MHRLTIVLLLLAVALSASFVLRVACWFSASLSSVPMPNHSGLLRRLFIYAIRQITTPTHTQVRPTPAILVHQKRSLGHQAAFTAEAFGLTPEARYTTWLSHQAAFTPQEFCITALYIGGPMQTAIGIRMYNVCEQNKLKCPLQFLEQPWDAKQKKTTVQHESKMPEPSTIVRWAALRCKTWEE